MKCDKSVEIVTLKDYLSKHTQQDAAEALGISQPAVAQIAASDRAVYLIVDPVGMVWDAHEVKRIGKFRGFKK